MNSIQVLVTDKTKNKCVHVRLIDKKDELGILYLSAEQYDTLLRVLRKGCFNESVDFILTDPFLEEESDDSDYTDYN
jgi:hypothetical protein